MVAEALALIGVALLVFVLLVTIYVATSRYKLAPSDQILVLYGNVKDKWNTEYGELRCVWYNKCAERLVPMFLERARDVCMTLDIDVGLSFHIRFHLADHVAVDVKLEHYARLKTSEAV